MVNVGDKPVTERLARAEATLKMSQEAFSLLMSGQGPKGDVLATSRVAGIQAAKRTAELIPLCHQLALTKVDIQFSPNEEESRLTVDAVVRCRDRTGVEMEALVAASITALTVYDMLKAVDREMVLEEVRLLEKQGGRTGPWVRPNA